MSPNRWTIGRVRITRVVEIEGPFPGTFILPDAVLAAISSSYVSAECLPVPAEESASAGPNRIRGRAASAVTP